MWITSEARLEILPSSVMPTFIKTLLVSLVLLFFLTEQAVGTSSVPTPIKPLCRLEVQNAHLSTTLLKHLDIHVVKVNVNSICNVEQTQVLITLEIHKKGEFGDHTYGPFINDQSPGKNSGKNVTLQNKYIMCLNSKPTRWFGVAYSKAFINGKWQYPRRTESQTIKPLLCGT